MTLRTITGIVDYPNAAIPPFSRVEFMPNGVHINATVAAINPVYAVVGPTGSVTVQLYPNDVGYGSDRYNVTLVTYTNAEYIKEVRRVDLGRIFVENVNGQILQDLLALFSAPAGELSPAEVAAQTAIDAASDAQGILDDIISLTPTPFAGMKDLAPRNASPIFCFMLMGQSWAQGFDANSTGAGWGTNLKNRVWSPGGSGAWGLPMQGEAPFNPNDGYNEGLEFANKVAETTTLSPYFYVNASGGESITAWVGTPANRTISVGNRPKWVELQAMIAAGVYLPDVVFWHQGVADHALYTPDQYAAEVKYLISQMTGAGYMTGETPFIIMQAPRGDRNLDGLSQNGYRTNNMLQACLRLGDPRISLVDLNGVGVYLESGGDPSFQHFTDAGYRTIGRVRMYAAFRSAINFNLSTPQDPGIAASMDKQGFMGFALRRSQLVTAGASYTCTIEDLNGTIDAQAGATITLPDFANTSLYTSVMRGGLIGSGITIWPTQIGTYTFNTNGTGFQGIGPLYTNTVSNPFVYVVGTRELNVPLHFRWMDGATWRVGPLMQSGPRIRAFSQAIDLPSIAAGARTTVTMTATGAVTGNAVILGLPNSWATLNLVAEAYWVSAADTISIRVLNTDGVARDAGNVAVTAYLVS